MSKAKVDIRTQVGDNVTYYMEARGLMPQQVADQAGVSLACIYATMKGKTYPRAHLIMMLSDILGVSEGTLLKRK